MAIPVFASTPESENAPIADGEDIFLLDLTQLSEEQLISISGNAIPEGITIDEGIWIQKKEKIINGKDIPNSQRILIELLLGIKIDPNATIIIIVYDEIGGNDYLIIIQVVNPDNK